MKVAELVERLQVVAPTLAPETAANQIEMERHFWFTGKHVLTFDERLGMQAPCDIGISTTISGRLLPLLQASHQTDDLVFKKASKDGQQFVEVQTAEDVAQLRAFDVVDTKKLFRMPRVEPNAPALTSKLGKVQRAIDTCLLAVSTDLTHPERCGITIIPEDGGLSLYSFNHESMVRCWLDAPHKGKERMTVPTQFWQILLGLIKGREGGVMVMLTEDEAVADVEGVSLYAKTLPVDQPTNFRKIFDDNFTETAEKRLVPITDDFRVAVNRALALSTGDANSRLELRVRDNTLLFLTDAKAGLADDQITFRHPDTSIKVKHKPLADAVSHFDMEGARVVITERMVGLTRADRVFMLASVS